MKIGKVCAYYQIQNSLYALKMISYHLHITVKLVGIHLCCHIMEAPWVWLCCALTGEGETGVTSPGR